MSPITARGARALLAALALLAPLACGSPAGPDAGELVAARSREQVLELEVAPERVPCTGEAPMECLLVRTSAGAPWERFYDAIEGFAFVPGHRYRLLVARRVVPDPPADASAFAYRLLAVLERAPA
jgi:hypothetical protein